MAETNCTGPAMQLYRNGEKTPVDVPPDAPTPNGYLDALVREIRGDSGQPGLTTADVLRASRVTLLAQDAADQGLTNVIIP